MLKAMSKEPESRYATAQELADDLRRFLDHKPIKAKRPTRWEMRDEVGPAAHRPCFHHVPAALTVLGLALSTAPIAAKQAEIVRQRDLADGQEERVRGIVDEMYTRLSERWLVGTREMRT